MLRACADIIARVGDGPCAHRDDDAGADHGRQHLHAPTKTVEVIWLYHRHQLAPGAGGFLRTCLRCPLRLSVQGCRVDLPGRLPGWCCRLRPLPCRMWSARTWLVPPARVGRGVADARSGIPRRVSVVATHDSDVGAARVCRLQRWFPGHREGGSGNRSRWRRCVGRCGDEVNSISAPTATAVEICRRRLRHRSSLQWLDLGGVAVDGEGRMRGGCRYAQIGVRPDGDVAAAGVGFDMDVVDVEHRAAVA